MTERENALNTILYGRSEWVPCKWKAYYICGLGVVSECGPSDDEGNRIGGLDDWGVPWVLTKPGSNAPTPDHSHGVVLDDICDWKEKVKIPDVDSMDWEAGAAKDLKNYDGTKLLVYMDLEGCFNRMTDLMGYEEALIAMVSEPEDAEELISAICDHKIRIVKNVAKYYKPDVFCFMDDLSSASGTMISPDTYRSLFKPYHKKIVDAIRENGMIAQMHHCGKWDAIADDLIEIGFQMFMPCQPSNDLIAIRKKHPEIVFEGGADSQGPMFSNCATEEGGRLEAQRCMKEYAPLGRYICHVTLSGKPNVAHMGFFDEAWKLGNEMYGRHVE